MKPWIVCIYGPVSSVNMFSRDPANGVSGQIHMNRRQEEAVYHGEVTAERHVYFCDDELTADRLISTLQGEYPGVTHIKARSVAVHFQEVGPRRVAEFSEKGLLPK